MGKLIWCLKQLLPLTYWGIYQTKNSQSEEMKTYFSIWHMWFGKTYNVTTINVNDYEIGKMQTFVLD